MDNELYDQLLNELKSGCTLILGPEFCRLDEDDTLNENLRDFIANKHLGVKTYINEDGFFYSNKITKKNYIVKRIGEYYRNLSNGEIPFYYNLLAQMPFSFIISFSPDDLLHQALNEQGKEHCFAYFKKGSELNELKDKALSKEDLKNEVQVFLKQKIEDVSFTPNAKRGLLFNFLGIYDDEESIVFTYDSLFQFLYSIFPETNLPNQLRSAFTSSSSFLFLGFQYDKWYLKVIFFLIEKIFERAGMELGKKAIFNFGTNQQQTVDFYENQFGMLFSREKTLNFIYQLHEDCEKRGLLSTSSNNSKPADKMYKVVQVSSNPEGVDYLDFDREYKRIYTEWLKSRSRDKFELKRFGAVTQKDLSNTLRDEEPELLVVSVHGKKDLTLSFSDEYKQEVPLSIDDFKKHLELLINHSQSKLKGILFNCCHSDKYAEEITKAGLVDYAIGMEGAIDDTAVPEFAEGFFGAYFKVKDFLYAYDTGCRFLEISNTPAIKNAATQPKLFTKFKA